MRFACSRASACDAAGCKASVATSATIAMDRSRARPSLASVLRRILTLSEPTPCRLLRRNVRCARRCAKADLR